MIGLSSMVIVTSLVQLSLWLNFHYLNIMMLINKSLSILFNQVINIHVTIISRLSDLLVCMLNLFDLPLMLENLASLFSQKLILLCVDFPELFLLISVEVRLDLEQITVEFQLLLSHIEMILAERFPLVVGISLLLFNLVAIFIKVTLILTMTVVVFELKLVLIVTMLVVNGVMMLTSEMMRLLDVVLRMSPVSIISFIVIVIILVTSVVPRLSMVSVREFVLLVG